MVRSLRGWRDGQCRQGPATGAVAAPLRTAGCRRTCGAGAVGPAASIAALRRRVCARAAAPGSAEDTAPVLRNPRAAGTSRSGTERAALDRGCRARPPPAARPRESPPTHTPPAAPATPGSAAVFLAEIYRCYFILLFCLFVGFCCVFFFFSNQYFFFLIHRGEAPARKRRHLFQPSASKKTPDPNPKKPHVILVILHIGIL